MTVRTLAPCFSLALLLAGCATDTPTDTGDHGSVDTDTADTADTVDTSETGDTVDTGETGDTDTGDTGTASLYDQLGGAAAISAVVDEFVAQVAADPQINFFFADTDIDALKASLRDQLCAATGGPCTYTGGTMVEVHKDMAITDAQFDALVADLLKALDNLGVPYALDGSKPIDPLLVALVGMRADIVTDADGSAVQFNQIGGYAGVSAVVDAFLARVVVDSRVNWFFADTDTAVLRTRLIEQVCSATGGYCTYHGGSMVDVHKDMAITDAQFNAVVEDLLLGLDDVGVPYALDGSQPIDSLLLALVGMQPDIVTDADGSSVYFNQLGGHAAVQAVVDQLLTNVAGDARINGFFASTDLAVLNGLLVEQVCDATGGYCTYSGKTMLDAHTGMGLTDADFDAMAEDLVSALDTLGVPHSDTLDGSQVGDTLLNTVLGMRGDIVGH